MSDSEPLLGERLVEALSLLHNKLNNSGVQRTYGLRQAMGVECEYYWKSLNLFLKNDYKDLKQIISEVNELFDKIEEEESNSGRKKEERTRK